MTRSHNLDIEHAIDRLRERRETLVFATWLALGVSIFYLGLMQLVLWSSPWWTQGAEFLVGR